MFTEQKTKPVFLSINEPDLPLVKPLTYSFDYDEHTAWFNVYGGKIYAKGGKYGAGIGGGYEEFGGIVNIYGGEITAEGGKEASGMGSGNEGMRDRSNGPQGEYISGGKITIYDGKVTARGKKYSAGIGGGDEGASGEIAIKGGEITAEGGDYGPGIGNGDDTDARISNTAEPNRGGYITISGGKITAKGGKEAAGIGSGNEGFNCTVNINGGYICSDGGKYGAAIGGGDQTSGGSINISGGTIILTNGEDAPDIGGGDECETDVTLSITGGTIKGDDIRFGGGTPVAKLEITLDGVTDPAYVEGIHCYDNAGGSIDYGVRDVQTMDGGKLYFYMSDGNYQNLTKITVCDENKIYSGYVKDPDNSYTFKLADDIELKMFTAKNEVYDGSPKVGYEQENLEDGNYDILFWNMKYDPIYYTSTGELTTPENSGAAREGAAPVYAGDYKVRINAFHAEDLFFEAYSYRFWPSAYYGHCELEFKIEKATPKIVEQPTLSGVYGTAVKDMEISGGIVKFGETEIEGKWSTTGYDSWIIPDVGTTNSYEVTFTPDTPEFSNYAAVTTMVVPNVEKAKATMIEPPTISGVYGTAVKDMEILGGVVKTENGTTIGATWTVTDAKASDVPDVGTTNSYEITFNSQNCNTITTMVVPNVEKANAIVVENPTLSGIYGTAVKDMEISGGVAETENGATIEGTWTITDAKASDVPDVGTTNSYELTFNSQNCNTITTTVVPNVEKANAIVVENPTLSGIYGTAVKDMEISGGVAETENGATIEGTWTITDTKASDIPDVGTTNSYELTFNGQNCNTITTTVVPNVEKATPVVKTNPGFSMYYDKKDHTLREKYFLIEEGVSGDVVSPCDENVKIEGTWSLTEDERKRLEEDPTYRPDSVECVFVPYDQNNYNLSETVYVEPEYYELDYIGYSLSNNINKQYIKDKIEILKVKLSDSEAREKIKEKILNSELMKAETKDEIKSLLLKNPEFKDKVRDKISNSELIEDEEVREKLLSFIEE